MTCRRSSILLALLFAGAALPALAGSADDPLADAAAAIRQGDGVSAEVAARKALSGGKPHRAVDAYLGEAALLQKNYDDARQWLGPAQFDAASAQRGFHALGRLDLVQGNYAAAARDFDQALQAGPPDAQLWVDIGRMRYAGGEQHLAADAVGRALAIDPREPQALAFQADLTRDSRGFVAALPWFERALQLAPNDLDLMGEYAATLAEAGRYRDMLAVARAMVKLDRTDPRAYFLQAVLAARAGNDELARRLMWRTNGEYDDTPAGLLLQGVLEYRDGSTGLAVNKFAELVRRQPDNELASRLLARSLLGDSDASEVVARFASAAARPEASPYMLTIVARAYEQLDRRDLAAPLLDRAAQRADTGVKPLPMSHDGAPAIFRFGDDDPTNGDVAMPTLRKMLSGGRLADAAAYASRLRARYPNSSDIEVLVGDAQLLGGNAGAALASYRSAARVRWTASLAKRIAAAEVQLGQDDAAPAELQAYLAQHPQAREIAALLGRAAAADGDWPRAELLLQHAARLPGGDDDPQALAELAEAQMHAGDRAAALASAQRAYALQRTSPQATAALAATLQASGHRPNGAEVLLAKARSMGVEPAYALR
jgi:tetratricopeptide (TPR) repeat protein